jgi:membrane protein implicated in regulation of membrane protease activity
MRQRIVLAIAGAVALGALAAILGGALDSVAAVVLVLALLLFVHAAFRSMDEAERREESASRWRGGPRGRGRRA